MCKKRFLLVVVVSLFAVVLVTGFRHKPQYAKLQISRKIPVFDCPALDTKNVIVISSDCGAGNGAIFGLQGTGTGTLVYTWYNVNNDIVGHEAEVANLPPGLYRVVLKDDSKCTPVNAFFTVLENNPVVIGYASAVITSPGCNQANGSITGINVTAATSYQWVNDVKVVVGNEKDLLNVPIGTYILTASNATGCIAQARYTLPPGTYAPILTDYSFTNTDCTAIGTFSATFDMKPTDPAFGFTLSNSAGTGGTSGQIAYTPAGATKISASGLPAGNYTLVASGAGFCITPLANFTVSTDPFIIDTKGLVIHTDVCGQNLGTIVGLQTKGSIPPNVHDSNPDHGWFWKDVTGKRVGINAGFLAGVPAGTYTVYAVSLTGCVSATKTFIIPDSISAASKPQVDDVSMCLAGNALFKVKNYEKKAYYNLYDSTKTLIATNNTGFFTQHVDNSTVFYEGAVDGICESPLAKINVYVAAPGVVIPNTFTPNQDGINDNWNITGLDRLPGTEISIYTRDGLLIYHSINYAQPFNGQYNGTYLPTGVYYYIVNINKTICKGAISGSLTLIR